MTLRHKQALRRKTALLALASFGLYSISMKQLHEDFFKRDAFVVAPDLIAKILAVRQEDGSLRSLRILETEVYYGVDDSASHARFGRTRRAGVLYEEGGALYVYLCYGIHCLLNFVTGEKDYPQGVLIRACEGVDGPGKLAKWLGITPEWHGKRLDQVEELQVLDDGTSYPIKRLPRVGIAHANEEDRNKLWRYQAILPGDKKKDGRRRP